MEAVDAWILAAQTDALAVAAVVLGMAVSVWASTWVGRKFFGL